MMKLLIMIIVVLTLTNCSKIQIGDFEWDPKTAMMRATFGVSKWNEHTVKVVAVHLNQVNGQRWTQTIVWIAYDN